MSPSPAIRPGSARWPSLILCALVACAGSLGLSLAGCEPRVDAELLHLDGLSTERLSPGNTVRIDGRGFPPGHPGEVSFEGIVHRPGEAPTPVTGRVSARAHSAGRLTFDVTPALVEELGGRGTFVGSLRTEFAASGTAVVSGSLSPATLELRPGGAGAVTRVLSQERGGREFLTHLGIRARALDDAAGGVMVESLTPAGLASTAGVRKEDRIIALGLMRVGDISDLVPPAGAEVAELVLARPGQSQAIRLQVPLVVRDETPSSRALLGATIASGLGLLLLLLLSPVARVTARIAKALVAPGAPDGHELLVLAASPRGSGAGAAAIVRVRHGFWMVVSAAALVVAFGVLPFSARMLPGAVDAGALALVVVGLAAAVRASCPGEVPALRRIAGWSSELLLAAPLLLAVAAVAIGTGTVGLEPLAAVQGGAPWQWTGLATPAGLLALPAAVISALVAPHAPREGGTARILDGVRLFVASSVITIVFLGAWRLPFIDGDPFLGAPGLRALAAALFVVKALVVLVIGLRLRRAFPPSLAAGSWGAVLGFGAVAVASVSLLYPTAALPAAFVGPVATVVSFVVLAVGLAHGARARPHAVDPAALVELA